MIVTPFHKGQNPFLQASKAKGYGGAESRGPMFLHKSVWLIIVWICDNRHDHLGLNPEYDGFMRSECQ